MEINDSLFKKIAYISTGLFVLSLIINIICMMGYWQRDTLDYNLSDRMPFLDVLFLGGIPIVIAILIKGEKSKNEGDGTDFSMRDILKALPFWAKALTLFLQLYGGFAFMFLGNEYGGTGEITETGFGLYYRGELLRVLTEQEYHTCKMLDLAETSAIAMIFYGVGAVMLYYPFKK